MRNAHHTSTSAVQPPEAAGRGSPGVARQEFGSHPLLWFFGLAFGLGWGVAIVMLAFQDRVEDLFGEIGYTNPVFITVVYSPAIAALLLVWRHAGLRSFPRLLRRITWWRLPVVWWIVLLLGIPAGKYLGAAFNGTAGDFPFSPWHEVFIAFVPALLIGPVEEIGWRGFALPLLQRRFVPLTAGLVLGALWGLWHLPAFLLSGTPQSAWSFGPYVVGVLALSVLLTPMFNASGGSLLVAMFFHFQMNGPAWPEAQPWENYVFALAAVVAVALNWRSMTSHEGAATEVLAAA